MPADYPVPFNDRDRQFAAASGGETSYATDFPIQEETDLVVRRTRSAVTTTLTLTTHYTVAIDPADGEATITLVTPAVAGDVYRLIGNTVIERLTDFAQRGAWAASLVNLELDRATMILQEMRRDFVAAALGLMTLPLGISDGGTGEDNAADAIAALAASGIVITTPAASDTKALNISQSGPASVTGPFLYNLISIDSNTHATGADGRIAGLWMQFLAGGANETGGGVYGIFSNMVTDTVTNSGDHIPLVGISRSNIVQSGAGELFGLNAAAYAESGANWPGVQGAEFDVGKNSGATILHRYGVSVLNDDNSVATNQDAAFNVGSTTSGGGFKNGLLFSTLWGQAPLQATGNVIAFDGAQTVDDVLDLTNLTITTKLIRYTNFDVTAAGSLSMAGILTISRTVPEIVMFESDAAADEKTWDIYANASAFKLDVLKDDGSGRTNFLTLTRSTNTPSLAAITTALHALSGTAIPAGGTAGAGLRFSSTSNFGIFFGSGAPSLAAAKGSVYLRSDGAINARLYINTDGSTTWTAFNTTS